MTFYHQPVNHHFIFLLLKLRKKTPKNLHYAPKSHQPSHPCFLLSGPTHMRGQQLPVPNRSLHTKALGVRRWRRLPGRLRRRPQKLRWVQKPAGRLDVLRQASRRSVPRLPSLRLPLLYGVVLLFQRGTIATASSAPTTPASRPLHTAMASRSAQMALMSTTVVSDCFLISLFCCCCHEIYCLMLYSYIILAIYVQVRRN